MHVDEPGRHGQAGRVDLRVTGRTRQVSDGCHQLAPDSDVCPLRQATRAVEHGPAADENIEVWVGLGTCEERDQGGQRQNRAPEVTSSASGCIRFLFHG